MWRPANDTIDWLTKRPLAHRGLHDLHMGRVENSLPAFAAAIKHDYSIECDVQLSSDGEAMVFHDDTLDRVTNKSGLVSAFTRDQLTSISYKMGGATIPTLTQLLELIDGQVGVTIEIKSNWTGNTRLAARVVECLRRYKGKAAIMSFDPVPIAWAADNATDVIRGMVADGATHSDYDTLPISARLSLREMRHAHASRPHFLSLDKDWLVSNVAREARLARLPMICWTVRSEQEARAALRWCDQVTFEGYLA